MNPIGIAVLETVGAVLFGALLVLILLATMTGCDLRIRSNMIWLVGCAAVIAGAVTAGVALVWMRALR